MKSKKMICLVCRNSHDPLKYLEGCKTTGFHESCHKELTETIRDADIVIAKNHKTGAESVLYGRSTLALIAGGLEGPKGVSLKVFRLTIDFDEAMDDLELFAGAVKAEKGHVDVGDEFLH